MSAGNVVDSRVVELSFDNKDFESNAKTSMSTLEKLKRALNFKSESKGFDDVNSSIKRINLDGLTAGVLGLKRSFGEIAKDVFIFRTLSNLIDSAERSLVSFGKTLTIGQVQSGWGKYAEKTSAVQTIMAATAKDFSDTAEQMEVVNQQLTKLNWFTDETSYSFIDMVSNIGKFTSNNVSLEDSVTAMEGISTWAAISGANVQNASHAMYNLSQAIATGSVKLMDWKSIENANMATAEFKETALETAASLGTLTKAADGTFKTLAGHEVSVTNFNQQLSDGWFTSQVLLDTLDKYGTFTEKLYEVMDSIEGDITTSTMLEWIESFKAGELDISKAAKEAEMSADDLKKVLTELGDESLEFGMKAFKAAQEAKTFEEAIDATKDAVSTGWMNTFEIIFGDYTKAKTLWTKLANDLWEVFASGGEKRNKLLREAFDTSTGITEAEWSKITQTGIASPAYIRAVRESAAEHGQAIDDMVTDEQWLEVALQRGYIKMSDLNNAYAALGKRSGNVDEALKSQVESAKEADEEFAALLSTLEQYGEGTIENVIFGNGQLEAGYEDLEHSMDAVIKKLGLSQEDGQRLVDVLRSLGYFGGEVSKDLYEMSNAELSALGYTDDQIMKLRLLQKEGVKLDDILEEIGPAHKTTGELWTETLMNGMSALVAFTNVLRETWSDVFPDVTSSNIVAFVDTLHSGSEQLLNFIDNSEELRTILTGVFSALDLGFGIVRTIGKSGFAILNGILEGFGVNLLDIAAKLGSFVTSIHDWVMENKVLEKITSTIGSTAKNAASTVKGWLVSFKNIPVVNKNLTRFKNAFGVAFKSFGPYMSEGANRVKEFFGRVSQMDGLSIDNIKSAFVDFKDNVLGYLANFPGFKALKGAILGLWNDIKAWLEGMGIDVDGIIDKFKSFGEGALTAFGYVGTAAKAAREFVSNLFSSFAKSNVVQSNLQRFKSGFASFFDKVGPFLSGGKEKIDEFIAKVQEMGGLKLGNLGNVFEAFKETVLSYFQNFDGFDGIKEAFSGLGEDIKAKLSDMGIDIDGIKEKIDGFVETVKAKVKEIQEFFGFGSKKQESAHGPGVILGVDGKSLDEGAEEVESIGDRVLNALGIIRKFLQDNYKSILSMVGLGIAVLTIKKIKDFVTSITDLIGTTKKTLKAATGAFKAAKIALIAIAILAIAGAIRLVAGLSVGDVLKGSAVIAGIMIALGILCKKLDALKGDGIDKAGTSMLKIAASVIIIVGAIWLLDVVLNSVGDNIARDLIVLAGIMVALGVLTTVVGKVGGKAAGAAGLGMLAIASSILIMIYVIQLLDNLTIKDPSVVLEYLAEIIVALVGTIWLVNKAGGGPTGNLASAAVIAALAAGILIIAGALYIIAGIDENKLDKAMVALGVIGLALGFVIFATSNLTDVKAKDIFMVIAVAAAIAVLGFALSALAVIDQDKLRDVSISLAIVLGAIAAIALVTGIFKPALSSLIMLGVILAAVAGALYLLTTFTNPDEVLKIALSLTLVLIALSASLLLLAAVGALAKFAAIGVLALVAFIAVFGLLGLLASFIPDPIKERILKGLETIKEVCAAIGEVMVVVAEYVGKAIAAFLGSGIEEFFSHLPLIGFYMQAFAAVLSSIHSLSLDNLLGVLEVLGIALASSIVGFADSILSIPSELMEGKSAAEMVASDLEALAAALLMWDATMTVIDEIDIPVGALAGLGIVDLVANIEGFVGSILSLPAKLLFGKTAAELVAGDIESLAEALAKWQEAMNKIGPGGITLDASGLIELGIADVGANLAGLFSSVVSIIPKLMFGKSAVQVVAEDIGHLGEALQKWQEAMDGIDELTVPSDKISALEEAVSSAATSGLMSSVKTFVSNLLSDEDKSVVETFKEDTGTLATALGDWQTKMNEIGAISVPKDVLDDLIEVLKELPGGTLIDTIGKIFGADAGERADDFKEDVTKLGEALQGFHDAFSEEIDLTKLQNLVDAAGKLAEVPATLRGTDFGDMVIFDESVDYLVKGFNLINDADVDVEKVGSLSTSASLVAEACKIFNEIDLKSGDIVDENTVNKLITSVGRLKFMIEQLAGLDTSGVDSFTDSLTKINGVDISDSMDKMSKAVANVDMSESGSAMADSMAKGLGSSTAIGTAANDAANAAAKAIKTDSFKAAGVSIGKALGEGVAASSGLNSAVQSLVSVAKSNAEARRSDFVGVGMSFATGLAGGILMPVIQVMAAARAIAKAALEAAKEAIKSNSPSKETMKLGNYFGEGFILGISSHETRSTLAGGDLAESARNGLANAIKGINSIIHDNIDGEPVIRPVLDLTNIQNGTGLLTDMLSFNDPIGVVGSLNAINSNLGMRSRSTNDDILAALNDLGRTIGSGRPGDTYNINGITYDDGSNVSDAVKSLIRATRVERRS